MYWKFEMMLMGYIHHSVKIWLAVQPMDFKRIFWFHFCQLPYAHCRLSYVSLNSVQSFGAVAPIEKAGEAIKFLGFHA